MRCAPAHDMAKISIPEKWKINGLTPRDGGFELGDQVFCVQSGCHTTQYIENSARLITNCFNVPESAERQVGMMDTGGLTWDFMVSVHRGGNVEDVIAVCMLVHGRFEPDDDDCKQLMYVSDVCTDKSMGRRGIAKVLMNAVYRLCFAMISDARFQCGRLWLVLDVDLTSTIVVEPTKLISFYEKCGFSKVPDTYRRIKPVEHAQPRWFWRITFEPKERFPMWQLVEPQCQMSVISLSGNVLLELNPGILNRIAIRIEKIIDYHLSFSTETPQSHSNDFPGAVLPMRPRSSRV